MQKISDYSINKITKTLENKFDLSTFVAFINDILNTNFNLQDTVNISEDKYRQHIGNISSFKRVGTFKDLGNTLIDVLVVTLKKRTTLENARAIQRNLVAGYLSSFPEVKNGAIVAFNSPDSLDWRLSFVKMDFILDGGKVRKELSPAKRYSYLVGPNENCHTAESRFASLIDADTQPTLNQIEDLFSVEKVTAKFFDEYRQLYELLVTSLKQNHTFLGIADKNHINTENFAKTLLGQIVFLYFVQKKGWLGADKGQPLNNGDRKFLRHLFEKADSNSTNYFNDWLEPLFYDALNNPKRSGVNSNYIDRFDGQIPFLNGGLFEPKYDWQNTFVIIDNQIFSRILEVFDRYNFTVKEDDPLDKEVAIDPEMLGKIFENLLEENLRKGKGTYYTPREIVHYMCKENLINYLSSSQPAIDKEVIRKLISWNGELWKDYIALDVSLAQKLEHDLSEIKIVDPACGSGAFLVGMLNEIVKARFLVELYLGNKPSLYQLKKSTIQSSIHGVDIDPGAIEIAKLRLWLSLVVDHELDEIEPLPNLDYKIMQGNSLVEDLILGDQSIKLFDLNVVKDKVPRKIMKNLFEEELQTSLFTDIDKESIFSKLKALQKEYFSQSDPSQKRKIRTQIEKIEGDAIRNCVSIEMGKLKEQKQNIKILPGIGIPHDELKRLQKIDNKENQIFSVVSELDKSGTKPYFLWHLYFYDVFAEKGGFDIVIGNPPYVSAVDGARENNNLRNQLRKIYKGLEGAFDLYVGFLLKGDELISSSGRYSWIIPNKFLVNNYSKKILESLISTGLFQVVCISDSKVFANASVYPILVFGERGRNNFEILDANSLTNMANRIFSPRKSIHSDKSIKDFDIEIASGTTGFQAQIMKKYLSESKTADSIPFVVSGAVDPYCINFENIRYMGNKYSRAFLTKGNEITNSKWNIYLKRKIIISGMTKRIEATYFEEPLALGVGIYTIHEFGGFNPLCLLGLLNSKFYSWYLKSKFKDKHLAGGYLAINKSTIEQLPLIEISQEVQKRISEYVSQMLNNAKFPNDQQKVDLERLIDSEVYKLYDLSPEEIKIIENDGKDKE